jgi:hypothetical protein
LEEFAMSWFDKDWGGLGSNVGKQVASGAGTAGKATVGAINATPGVIGSGVGKVWNSGTPGKVGLIGAGALVGTRIAYPLLSGANVIDDQTQEYIGNNPVGSFVTGEPAIDPLRSQAIYQAQAEEYENKQRQQALDDQARLLQEYKDKVAYDADMSYQNAQRMGRLGMDLGTAASFRDVYADQLRNSTGRYIDTMRVANEAIGKILSPQVTVI